MNRYEQLAHVIDLVKPQSIVEIGTHSGKSAVMMINRAKQYREVVEYIGFDLFEEATDETDKEELNIKAHHSVESVEGFIKMKAPSAEVLLVKGNTRQTLNHIEADLAFIDGGHSLETIANDYEKCKGSKVIVLDDYYTEDENGNIPDLELYGCNKLVETLPNALVLPIRNIVKTGGLVQMVLVVGGGK